MPAGNDPENLKDSNESAKNLSVHATPKSRPESKLMGPASAAPVPVLALARSLHQ